jgi:DNA-directed RNA polymerase specialized sigma24 family protein
MAIDTVKTWPPLEAAYTDEFGEIDLVVYEAARQLWPTAEKLAREELDDPALKQQLLLKAAADVTPIWCNDATRIDNLPGYLFKVYKRLLWRELLKTRKHHSWEAELEFLTASLEGVEEVERKILIQQILNRLDSEMRFVFEMRIFNHSFEEIARFLNCSPHTLRTRYSKQLARLRQQIRREIKPKTKD